MTARRLAWLATPLVLSLLYLMARSYADQARSMEAVLGLFHGDPLWHALVAMTVIALRIAAWGALGGTLLAWPLEELFRAWAPSQQSGPRSHD